MKKFLTTVAILPFLAVAGNALADDAQGKIAAMNSWSITLENGKLFSVADQQAIKDLKPGDEVRVNYVDFGDTEFQALQIQRLNASN